MRVYLAGPIDYEKDKGTSWRVEIKGIQVKAGKEYVFFDPVTPYYFTAVTSDVSQYIHDINMVALCEADVVVARLMKGQTSVGTPIELYEAIKRQISIILITDMDDSVYMKYIGIGAKVVGTIAEAIDELGKMELTKIREEPLVCMHSHPVPHIDLFGIPHSLRNLKFVDKEEKDEEDE